MTLEQLLELVTANLGNEPVAVGSTTFKGLKASLAKDRVGLQLLTKASAEAGPLGSLLRQHSVHERVTLQDVKNLVATAEGFLKRHESTSQSLALAEETIATKNPPRKNRC